MYNSLLAEIKPPQDATKVVFAGAFKLDFGFTLRDRKYCLLDLIQIDALYFEANFTSTGKWRGRTNHGDRRRGKEESSSSS